MPRIEKKEKNKKRLRVRQFFFVPPQKVAGSGEGKSLHIWMQLDTAYLLWTESRMVGPSREKKSTRDPTNPNLSAFAKNAEGVNPL